MRPIRQPGGYYSDFSPTLVLPSSPDFKELVAKKTDKLSVRSPSPFRLPPALLLSHWGYPIVPVSLTEPSMSNWVTMAWPVPSVTLGTCHRATASLPSFPHSYPPDHILRDLRLSGKDYREGRLKESGGPFTNHGLGVGALQRTAVAASSPALPSLARRGLAAPGRRKELCTGYCP